MVSTDFSGVLTKYLRLKMDFSYSEIEDLCPLCLCLLPSEMSLEIIFFDPGHMLGFVSSWILAKDELDVGLFALN
jgi:hypothetical protein